MTSVIVDPGFTDDQRRERLYAGDIVVHTGSPALRALFDQASAARELVALERQRADGHDPR